MKMQKAVVCLKNTDMFSVLSDTELNEVAEKSRLYVFGTGDVIGIKNHITVILSGSATVTKNTGDKRIILRMMSVGSVSGVATLFPEANDTYGTSDCDGVSEIKANRKTEVLAIPSDTVVDLIDSNSEFRRRYILFLTSRIKFLNGRIRSYVSQGAAARLALHILLCDENQSGTAQLSCSASKLAEMLDVGRASLYRAFDTLTEKGIIERNGRTIIILDRCALKNIADGNDSKNNGSFTD